MGISSVQSRRGVLGRVHGLVRDRIDAHDHASTVRSWAEGRKPVVPPPDRIKVCEMQRSNLMAAREGRHLRMLRFAVSLLACALATGAAAQYPDRPIRLIVLQAAGSRASSAPSSQRSWDSRSCSSSNGSPGHVGGELFKFMSGIDTVHVPYRGGAAAINDLIAGRVHLMFESLNSIAPHARSGAVRALAVSGTRRSPGFPDLPTVAEAGVPGYAAPTWSGVIAPAGVPRPIIDRLNAAINGAIQSPTFRDRFAVIGDEPAGGTPEEFAELIRADSAKWGEVVRRSGARLD